MTKDEAIGIISGLYPADAVYEDTRQAGRRLLTEAMEEANCNWSELPERVLIIYAEKCTQLENQLFKPTNL